MGRCKKGADEEHHATEAVDGAYDVTLARHIDQREVLPKDTEGQYGKENDKSVGSTQDGPDHQSDQKQAGDGALNQTGEFHIK